MNAPGPSILPGDGDRDRPNTMLRAVLLQQAMIIHMALFATEPDAVSTSLAAKLVHEIHTAIDLNAAQVWEDVETSLRASREEREANDERGSEE